MNWIRKKMAQLFFIYLVAIFSWAYARAGVNHVQVCPITCESGFCKKIIDEIEFELELSKDVLLPACDPKHKLFDKEDFRLLVSEEDGGGHLKLSLECGSDSKCLDKKYDLKSLKSTIIANDLKKAMSDHNTPPISTKKKIEPVVKVKTVKENTKINQVIKSEPKPIPVIEPSVKIMADDEWDHVLLSESEKKEEDAKPQSVFKPEHAPLQHQVNHKQASNIGHVTMSFGGETWNYFFDSVGNPEQIAPIHARVYPRTMFTTTVWATTFLRFSIDLAASFMNFRLRANQAVDGDGQIVGGQSYQSQFVTSLLIPLFGVLHIGGDVGYEFNGIFVGPHFLDEKSVTIVPGYQSHAFRVGPRIVVGANSKKGMIDIGAGFYPVLSYFETPDEPTVFKEVFAFSVHAVIRMMLSQDIFSDVSLRMHAFHVNYESEAQRKTVEGEAWGPGFVSSNIASATMGLGYLF